MKTITSKRLGIFSILIGLVIMMSTLTTNAAEQQTATFAGGCFWCMTPPFRQLKGVKSVVAGYTGGHVKNPTYEDVSSGETGHLEAVLVTYDPTIITYDELLEVFWRNVDPTQGDGQFADRGSQYHTAIFFHNDDQKRLAEASKQKLDKSGKYKDPIQTKILPAVEFYEAETYHQSYDLKNPMRYKLYKEGSGRADYIKQTWGDNH